MKFPWSRKPAAPPPAIVDPSAINEITGSFELLAGRISGRLSDPQRRDLRRVTLVVQRHGRTIFQTLTEFRPAADHHPHRGEYVFSVPIEGIFNARELLTSGLTVTAVSEIGLQGRLNLDGGSSLALVRTYLNEPAETLIDIDFGANGDSRDHVGEGWYGTEPKYTWTKDTDSYVAMPTITTPGRHALRLLTGALVGEPFSPNQYIEIFLNDEMIGTHQMKRPDPDYLDLKFAGEHLMGQKLRLRLHHPDAKRPCDVWNDMTDTRILALSVRQITLVRFL